MIEKTFSDLLKENEKLFKRINHLEAMLGIATQALESLDSGALISEGSSLNPQVRTIEASVNATVRNAIAKIKDLKKLGARYL